MFTITGKVKTNIAKYKDSDEIEDIIDELEEVKRMVKHIYSTSCGIQLDIQKAVKSTDIDITHIIEEIERMQEMCIRIEDNI